MDYERLELTQVLALAAFPQNACDLEAPKRWAVKRESRSAMIVMLQFWNADATSARMKD